MTNPPDIAPDTLLVFLGHSDDADNEATAVLELETPLQREVDQLLVWADRVGAVSPPRFRRIRFWCWTSDMKAGAGGQSQNVGPYLQRANAAVFVFKERVGEGTWDELNKCRQRGIPILALFPAEHPAPERLTHPVVARAWADLCEKRESLSRGWNDPGVRPRPIAPVPRYKDRDHLARTTFEQVKRLFIDLLDQVATEGKEENALPATTIRRPPIVGLNFQDFRDKNRFKNRENEIHQIQTYLANPNARFVYIVGVTGIGKTALLARLCDGIESDRCHPTASGKTPLQGLVYCDFRGANARTIERLFHDLCQLLDNDSADQLARYWGDPGLSDADKFHRLLGRLRDDVFLLAIDNFEQALSHNHTIADDRLQTFLEVCLQKPHGLRIVATSRQALGVLKAIQPDAVFAIQLDRGLPTSEGIAFLRDLDLEGDLGLRDADERDLETAVTQCSGRPSALRAIATTLAVDPTLDLSTLLNNASLFEDNVVERPLDAQYEQLPNDLRRVLETLAIYDEPVPAPAIEAILAHVFPRIHVLRALEELADYHLVQASRDRGTYAFADASAQQVVYDKISDDKGVFNRIACHRRAASYYSNLHPTSGWTSFDQMRPLLSEFHHLVCGHQFSEAAGLVDLVDVDYLQEWGEYQTALEMREQLKGQLPHDEHELLSSNHGNLAMIYRRLGRTENVERHFDQAISYARRAANRSTLSVWHCERGNLHADRIDMAKAVDDYNLAVDIARQTGDRTREEARAVGCLAIVHRQLGQLDEALRLYHVAIEADKHNDDQRYLALHKGNMGKVFLALGDVPKAVGFFETAVVSLRDQQSRYLEAVFTGHLGEASVMVGRLEEAIQLFRESINRLRDLGESRSSSYALEGLGAAYQLQDELGKAREAYEQCRCQNQPETTYRSLVMLGVLSLEEGDALRANEYFHQGIDACVTILAKAPRFYEAIYRLALAYAASNECDKAMNEFRRALSACGAKGVRDDALRDLRMLRRAAPAIACLDDMEHLLSGRFYPGPNTR